MMPDPIRNPILAKHYGSLGPPGENDEGRPVANGNGLGDQVGTGYSNTFYLNRGATATAAIGGYHG